MSAQSLPRPSAAFARRVQYAVFLRQLNQGERVTQDQLAREVSKQLGLRDPLKGATAGKWLGGLSVPDIDTIDAIARVLGIDSGWLAMGARSQAPAPYNEAAGMAQQLDTTRRAPAKKRVAR